jgi:putative transposase
LEEKDYWTTREVLELINEKYGIEYSQKQIAVILHSFNMCHSKPYILDYRKPENAEEILKKVNRSNSSIYWSK